MLEQIAKSLTGCSRMEILPTALIGVALVPNQQGQNHHHKHVIHLSDQLDNVYDG
jgi:hypothetical protein